MAVRSWWLGSKQTPAAPVADYCAAGTTQHVLRLAQKLLGQLLPSGPIARLPFGCTSPLSKPMSTSRLPSDRGQRPSGPSTSSVLTEKRNRPSSLPTKDLEDGSSVCPPHP